MEGTVLQSVLHNQLARPARAPRKKAAAVVPEHTEDDSSTECTSGPSVPCTSPGTDHPLQKVTPPEAWAFAPPKSAGSSREPSRRGEREPNALREAVSSLNDKSDRVKKPKGKKLQQFTYTAERVIGNGSFGIVYEAKCVETGDTVAIKKVFQDKRFKNRELEMMQELVHPNIVQLKHAFYTPGEEGDPGKLFLNVVMEYVSETVYRVLKHYTKLKHAMPEIYVKLYTYQMCRGLAYVHSLGICHRDVKPQNLLLNGKTHVLKVCDFGSAKRLIPGEANVAYICSRYYRAPELIFGATDYTTSIDLWSMGCVIAEMLKGTPIFPGESGVDQLVEVIKVLGTPKEKELQAMNPNYVAFEFPMIKPQKLYKVFPGRTSPEAVELLENLLRYDPESRAHPLQACTYPFFDQLRDPNMRLPLGKELPDIFDVSPEELKPCSPAVRDMLVPSWYMETNQATAEVASE